MSTRTVNRPARAPRTKQHSDRARTAAGSRTRPGSSEASGTYLLLVGVIAVLVVIGVVMVLSASSVLSLTSYGSAWYFFQRQLIWTLLGVIAFAVIVRIDYHRWASVVRPLLAATSVLLVAALVPGIGV